MNLCPWMLLSRRSIAVTFAILVGIAASNAEQIRFSKPATEIPAPYKPDENLPETQSKRVGFSAPGVAAPAMPQPTIIHIQPRYEDEDDRLSTRGSRRSSDPKRDPRLERDSVIGPNSSTHREAFPGELWRGDAAGIGRPETQRALSPEMDFHWNARESSTDRNGSPLDNRPPGERTVDRKGAASPRRETYATRNELLPSSPFSDLYTPRPKEKPGRELLDRRAAFEQMLNPSASIAGRPPGSLEPVPPVEMPKNVAPFGMPPLGTAALNPKSTDPVQAVNVRERLNNPIFEEMNRKYSTPSAKAPSVAVDSRLQTPLNRQPTSRELPTRRF